MLSRFVEEGSKVELRALEHGLGESGAENTTKVYQSRVLQILSEDTLEISMPMEQTMPLWRTPYRKITCR